MHWTPAVVDGLPVYEDLDHTVRAVIEQEGVARLLEADTDDQEQPVTAVALL